MMPEAIKSPIWIEKTSPSDKMTKEAPQMRSVQMSSKIPTLGRREMLLFHIGANLSM